MLASLNARGLGHVAAAGGPIVIHPGGGSPAKCWPLAKFIELAAALKAAGRGVRFVIGEVEQERWPAADIAALREVADVDSLASLTDLLDRLKSASTFVGNDSGPGHIAGILGVPTVSLFGSTDPTRWRPIGPKVSVVQAETLNEIAVEQVLKAVAGED